MRQGCIIAAVLYNATFVTVGDDQANGQETVIFSQANSQKFAPDLTSVAISSHITSVSADNIHLH